MPPLVDDDGSAPAALAADGQNRALYIQCQRKVIAFGDNVKHWLSIGLMIP